MSFGGMNTEFWSDAVGTLFDSQGNSDSESAKKV